MQRPPVSQLAPKVDVELAGLVNKLLQKNQNDRGEGAEWLCDWFEKYLTKKHIYNLEKITLKLLNAVKPKLVPDKEKPVIISTPTQSGSHVVMTPNKQFVKVGRSTWLQPRVEPKGSSTKLIWSVDKPKIISVSGGKVMGLKQGYARVTVCSADDKTKNAICDVHVK